MWSGVHVVVKTLVHHVMRLFRSFVETVMRRSTVAVTLTPAVVSIYSSLTTPIHCGGPRRSTTACSTPNNVCNCYSNTLMRYALMSATECVCWYVGSMADRVAINESIRWHMLLLSRVRGPLVTAGFLVAVSFVFVRVDHCVVLQGLYLCTCVVCGFHCQSCCLFVTCEVHNDSL